LSTLQSFGEEVRFAFITSDAQVFPADKRPDTAVPAEEGSQNAAWIIVAPTEATKCVRCWHKRPDVGSHPGHPEICGRCVTNVTGEGEVRKWT
jgi:isoleucyl-tRNA synthetase